VIAAPKNRNCSDIYIYAPPVKFCFIGLMLLCCNPDTTMQEQNAQCTMVSRAPRASPSANYAALAWTSGLCTGISILVSNRMRGHAPRYRQL
jgi:hypothetical protein